MHWDWQHRVCFFIRGQDQPDDKPEHRLDYHNISLLFLWKFPDSSEIQGDHCHGLDLSLDYECSNLVHQTQRQGMQCSKNHRAWKVWEQTRHFSSNNAISCPLMETESSHQMSMSDFPMSDWVSKLIIVSQHWSSLPEQVSLQWWK